MPTAKTVLEHIEVDATGTTFIQWRKQIVADDGTLMFNEAHRTSMQPQHFAVDHLGNVGALMPATNRAAHLAAVDAHLVKMGWPATSPTDKATIALQDVARLAVVATVPVLGV